MCARNEVKMEPASVMRFNSSSTSKTLVGSEAGLVSPITSPLGTLDRKLLAANPIVQTPDSKEWLDLDSVSPKLLRELRRQYDPSFGEEKGPLAKGAARIKAWSRSTKRGLEIRLRRKVSQEHDVVTDFRLFINATSEEEPSLLPEMPGEDTIFEMPDTSITPELSTEPRGTRRESMGSVREPLPKYEPPASATSQDRPRLQLVPVEASNSSESHGRSSSQSSIVSTPTDGLPVRAEEREKDAEDCSGSPGSEDASKGQKSEGLAGTTTSTEQTGETYGTKEELRNLLNALKEHLANQPQHEALVGSNHLKIEETARYETETDVEPPSPNKAKRKKSASPKAKNTTAATDRKPSLSKARPQILKKASAKTEPLQEDVDLGDAPLPRRRTIPPKVSKKAGAEAVWARLLQTQGKILGAEHPLVYESRHALSLSRVSQHKHCSTGLLSSLYQTEEVAKQTLGRHPFVQLFTVDFKTLRALIIDSAEVGRQSPTVGTADASKEDVTVKTAPSEVQKSDLLGPGVTSDAPSPEVQSSEGPSQKQSIPRIQTTFVETSDEPHESSKQQIAGQDLWNVWRPPHQPKHDAVVLSGLVFAGLTTMLKRGINWLERSYGPEPPVQAGKVRVRWTCSCGDQLYDDFTELRPGAGRALEAYLNRPRTRTGGGSPTTPSSASGRSFNSSVGGTLSTQTSWTSYSGSSRGSPARDTKHSQTTASLPQYTPFTPLDEPPWLLTCANEDRFIPKVAHLDMSRHKITSDKDLAKTLREHYFEINRKWWKRLKLRGLTTIEFVQFECHQNRFADIRKCPDMPPQSTGEYTFEPGELLPPVGPKYLMHLFQHPEDYDSELITYLRAPKKSGRLQLGVGWGINLVEGFLADRVWLLVNALFGFASLVFGVAWACEKNDIQGAFGVAQWVCMLAVFAGGWIQACLG